MYSATQGASHISFQINFKYKFICNIAYKQENKANEK